MRRGTVSADFNKILRQIEPRKGVQHVVAIEHDHQRGNVVRVGEVDADPCRLTSEVFDLQGAPFSR
jgi:hypothetical protein